MPGKQAFTENIIRDQLSTVEWLLSCQYNDNLDHYYMKWRRHYLLKRLLTIQIRDFNRE